MIGRTSLSGFGGISIGGTLSIAAAFFIDQFMQLLPTSAQRLEAEMASYAMLTNVGRNKEAAALANGTALDIAEIAWGDGTRIPAGGETALDSEQGRKPVAAQGVTAGALNTAFFEVLLAEDEGPFIIREAGLFDVDGALIAVAYYDPPVNKPLNTVSAHLRINVIFSDLENLIIKIDASTAFISAERTITAGTGLNGGGDLSADRSFAVDFATQAEGLAGARTDKTMSPKRVAEAIQSLAPSAVIASQIEAETGAENTKTMTPLRVAQAITQAIDALIAGAPGALDTLQELATALGDNDDAIAALVASIATKLNTADYTAADILAKLLTVDDAGLSALNEKLLGTTSFAASLRWLIKSGAYTAKAGERIATDVSGGAWQLNLPAAPTAGDAVIVAVVDGDVTASNLTIDGNGNNVQGDTTLVVDVALATVPLVFNGTEWRIS